MVAVSTMFPVYSVTYLPGLYQPRSNTRLLRPGALDEAVLGRARSGPCRRTGSR